MQNSWHHQYSLSGSRSIPSSNVTDTSCPSLCVELFDSFSRVGSSEPFTPRIGWNESSLCSRLYVSVTWFCIFQTVTAHSSCLLKHECLSRNYKTQDMRPDLVSRLTCSESFASEWFSQIWEPFQKNRHKKREERDRRRGASGDNRSEYGAAIFLL